MHHEQAQAADAVRRVLAGATLTTALQAAGQASDARASGKLHRGRGHALVHELAYGTLRHYGTVRAIAAALATRPVADPGVKALLAVALYQLRETHAPAFAVVDRAVEAVAHLGHPRAGGLVNAVLRRYLRERAAADAAAMQDPVGRWSHPRWWIERVRADHPAHWETILAAGNARPPLTLRVNARVTTRDALLGVLREHDIEAHAAGVAGAIVDAPRPPTELPGFAEGAFAVQDLAAQLAAPLLDARDGMRVLDACSAPGGKAAHLLELALVALVALDADRMRLARVRDNLDRLVPGARDVQIVEGDARTPSAWWDGRAFDRILADVPCTASGVVRRHPDGKWLRRESDVGAFAATQAAILDALWPLLAPGGKLLYATCSVFAAENEQRVEAFCAAHADALRETLTFPAGAAHVHGQLLPSAEAAGHNQDGFYYALLRKA
jgi:16S rRNA (cytosine967-C5)-methyltransferase